MLQLDAIRLQSRARQPTTTCKAARDRLNESMISPDGQFMTSADNNSLAAVTSWLAQLITGSIGTTIAIIAVALTGFSMLHGRISARDAARIVLGCFILFGAPSIARSFLGHQAPSRPATRAEVYTAPPGFVAPPSQQNNDPYAGASVPM